MYGVLNWGAIMPEGFPISVAQNSGNMVHAQAPLKMFPNTVGVRFGYRSEGYSSFVEFVNETCEALIIPFANTIRDDKDKDENILGQIRSLERYTVPIIPFGLGAQASSENIDEFELGSGMQAFVRFLNERAPAISVRGQFTREVFAKYGTTENVYVTGCPSFFSHPEAFENLYARLRRNGDYTNIAFSGSLHHQELPKNQLYQAIEQDLYLVEPVNKHLHQFYLDCINNVSEPKPAYFLNGLLKNNRWNIDRLKDYMIRRYRLFRDLHTWMEFNRESVDATVGTRFHVNMASILSGIPAVWIAHDSRTYELCRQLSLPFVDAEESVKIPYGELVARADFKPMFDALPSNFARFNDFLTAAGLPTINAPELTVTSSPGD